jgi:hypothetical protein
MMQLDRQSRWQSWMRMLAVGLGTAQESARSRVPRKWVSVGAIRPLIGALRWPLNATSLNVGRTYEDTE